MLIRLLHIEKLCFAKLLMKKGLLPVELVVFIVCQVWEVIAVEL